MRPLLSIWTKPTETFEYLSERRLSGKENHLGFLIVLISYSLYLARFEEYSKPIDGSALAGFFVSFTIAPVAGLIAFRYIYPFFVWKIGKIFKGKATFDEIQLVLVYSSLPLLIYPVLAFIFIVPYAITNNMNLILHPHGIVAFVCSILSIRIAIYGLSRFNNYTYGYSVLNIFILGAFFEAISLLLKH